MKSSVVLFVFLLFCKWASCCFAAATVDEHTGTWKWTTQGRNGQPEESTLKLAKAVGGSITGILSDRAGEHVINDVSLKGNGLEFTVVRETPNGKVSIGYSLKLGSDRPKISIEHPDSAPSAKKSGKKRKTEVDVTRHADNPSGAKS